MVITYFRGLRTPLITTHEPPSKLLTVNPEVRWDNSQQVPGLLQTEVVGLGFRVQGLGWLRV